MIPFNLDPRLKADSSFITDLTLCQVRLSHNAAFPWILLIPQQSQVSEIIDLSVVQQELLMQEIVYASHIMKQVFQPQKLNVASLGNVVPQLHIHIIARFENDAAWPGPVWNSGITEQYNPQEMNQRIASIQTAFLSSVISLTSPLSED